MPRPRGRPRKYAGPKMRDGRFKSKTKTKTGLNTTEKKQVNAMILNKAESKYFDVESRYNLSELKGNPIQTGANMYCLGFSTGWNLTGNPTNPSTINYGVNAVSSASVPLVALHLDQVHLTGTQKLVGDKCEVDFQKSTWLIERTQVDTDSAVQQIKDALPTFVRVIRVRPKNKGKAFTSIEPNKDLFLDQENEPYGISTSNFKKIDIRLGKVNNRKYSVLNDNKFTLLPPFTQNDLDIGSGTNQVRNINKDNTRIINMSHKLGKKYYYDLANMTGEHVPMTGGQSEYIFFHFQHMGDDSTFASRASADDWRISCIPCGAFKDI